LCWHGVELWESKEEYAAGLFTRDNSRASQNRTILGSRDSVSFCESSLTLPYSLKNLLLKNLDIASQPCPNRATLAQPSRHDCCFFQPRDASVTPEC